MERALQHGQEGVQPTKKAQRKTGGGPAPGEPSETSKMIVEVYDNAPGFSGITGGFESGEYCCDHYFTLGHTQPVENTF